MFCLVHINKNNFQVVIKLERSLINFGNHRVKVYSYHKLFIIDRLNEQNRYIIEDIEHSLLCQIQTRVTNVIINNIPKSIRSSSSQSVKIPEYKSEIYIEFRGPIPFIRTQYQTKYDMGTYDWIDLTSRGDWDLHIDNFNFYSIKPIEVKFSTRLYDIVIRVIQLYQFYKKLRGLMIFLY